MKHLSLLLLALFLLLGASYAAAQEDLPETYTSADGALTFNYPAGWGVYEDEYQIVGGTPPELVEAGFGRAPEFTAPDQAAFAMVALPFADLGLPPDASLVDVMVALGFDGSIPVQETTIDEVPLLYFFASAEQTDGPNFFAARMLGPGYVGVFVGITPAESLESFLPTFLAILASAVHVPPPPPTGIVLDIPADGLPAPTLGTDGVVWSLDLEASGFFSDEIAVNASGAIYLTVPVDDYVAISDELDGGSGFFGVLELDADGNAQRVFYLEETDLESGSNLALESDGSFWYASVDFEGIDLAHFAADGSLLSSVRIFDGYPGEARIFIALDAADNAFVNVRDEVSVWSADGTFVRDLEYSGRLLGVSPDGRLFFHVGGETPMITATDPEGSPLAFTITLPEAMTYATPAAVSGDFLYLATPYGVTPAVYQYDAEGALVGAYALPDASDTTTVNDMVALPNGDVLIAYGSSRLIRVQPSVFSAAA